jgi:hypothetical protein
MKLSNKILLGFFGFIFLYLTAAFAELRLTGNPNVIDDGNSIAETADISGVKYVVIRDMDTQINVIGSDRAQLEVRSFSGNLLTKLNYKISGDTLTLSGVESKEVKTIKISVFVPNTSLKGITVNSSVAIVRGLQPDVLSISQKSGTIWMSESRITKIEMDLDDSYLDISGTPLDTLSANIERSEVSIDAPVGLLQGSMKTSSMLRMGDIGEIQFKKDETSRLNLFP